MTWTRRSIVMLLLPVGLLAAGPAEARRSVGKIEGELQTIEGQLGHYLTTIRPPSTQVSARELGRRLVDGMVLYRMKDYSRASIVLMDIVTRHPGTPAASEASFYLADSMFQQREFVVARTYFERVVNEGSGNRYYQLSLQRLLELEMRRAAVLGKAQTADAERLKQVEALLSKIEAIPAAQREASVEYVRGKYLFFRGQVDEALKIFANLGPSHPYYLQGVYFLGVCHLQKNRLNAAAAVYKQLIDKVLFNYFRAKTATQRQVLQLIILAAARIAYVRGKGQDIERAIELYNAIPRKSPYFDDALYERAWAYLKAKRYDRAVQALELLNAANPNYPKADEARVLLGNLKIQSKDFGGAKAVFRSAAAALRPVYRKLRGLQGSGINPKAIFAQLTSEDLEKFEIEVRLPPLALRWLRKEPAVKRAMLMLGDLSAVQRMISESQGLIRSIERSLRSGSMISRYPALAVARARGADFETQLLALRGDVAGHLRDLVLPNASPSERIELERLKKEQAALRAKLKAIPSTSDAYQVRVKKMQVLFDGIDSTALEVEMGVKNLEATLRAIESYYYRTLKTQRIPKAVMEQNLKAVKQQIVQLRTLIRQVREDVADGRSNVGIDDSVMRFEKYVRARLAALLQREQQIAGAIASRLTPAQAGQKARLDALVTRIGQAQQNLVSVNRRIDGYLASKKANVVRILTEEKAKVMGYRQQVALYQPSSEEVVGGVALQSFRRVSTMVHNVLVKADVGVLDVVWALKNLAKGQYEKRESLFMRAMESLKAKYREPRGEP